MRKVFSFIIPIYNGEKHLRRCLDSIVAQSFSSWEAICVDDGSQDESMKIVNEYRASDARIKVVAQKNGGVVAARMNGLLHADSEYVWFVDCDDEVPTSALAEMSNVLQEQHVDILHFAYTRISMSRSTKVIPAKACGMHTVAQLMDKVVETPMEITDMCIGNKIYRQSVATSAFAKIGDVRIKHGEDGLFAVAALLSADSYMIVDKSYYNYYINEGSSLSVFNPNIVAEKEVFLSKLQSLWSASCYANPEVEGKITAFHAFDSICYILNSLMKQPSISSSRMWHVAHSLSKSPLVVVARRRAKTWRRKIPVLLASHPYLFLVIGQVVRARKRVLRFICVTN